MSTAGGTGGGPKDCYSHQAYPAYGSGSGSGSGSGNGSSAPSQAKKTFRGSKVPTPHPSQHLPGPGGYSNHMGPGNYSAQYMSEGHLQQKWEDQAQIAQYDQEMVGRMEAAGTPAPGSSQYVEQNILGHSQTQCHQPSTPAYTSPQHPPHPTNPAPPPLMYPQSHMHYPQHSPSPLPYIEKCNTVPHCYKGYSIPPSSPYSRQMSSHSKLNQGGYRSGQNNYSYQQPPARGFEQQSSLQAMASPQETHTKYPHYNQAQQNYCLSDLSVRSPEQYYQTCSPSSSHSPARSVGRSPSYSSTPSPLMTNPESFQYGQPPMTPGAASSSSTSSAGIQDQVGSNSMLMPPRSHASPNVQHAASHSYTTTPQVPSMKERFSEKLLSNPSLWSLNALTSQVENISNNVQQLLLSEALVASKKGNKRNTGGSNCSAGGAPSKKGEEYKSPPYPDGGTSLVGGTMQDPYSTPQHQSLTMELHEGGYSSSSDEQLDRGYYYCGQSRSPAQVPSNVQLNLDTASSCSMTSPDDMSTRSGDSGLHTFTPDISRCQSGLGGDDNNAPLKSISDERSPTSVTISSPMKQERDSPSDLHHINMSVKENFEESAWRDKPSDKKEATLKNPDRDTIHSTENLEKWSDEKKYSALYSKVNKSVTEKGYCYKEPAFQEVMKYDSDARDSTEQSPAALSDFSHKENFSREMKSDAFKSESPTTSESSVKTLPFISRDDFEQDRYAIEKEDKSENTFPTRADSEESNSGQRVKKCEEDEDVLVGGEDTGEEEEDGHQKQTHHSLSPPLSTEGREELLGEGKVSLSTTEKYTNNREGTEQSLPDLNNKSERQSAELDSDTDSAGVLVRSNAAVAGASERETAVGDTVPQPQSAMPVFSALNDKATPSALAREHMDHGDAKVLEPDSPQLPGKSILPSAPSWADTPPSPKKGDEDMEPGISCASAVTPMAKAEPLAPSAQPRAYGRKQVRGRRRVIHSAVGIRQQLGLEQDREKEDGDHMLTEKTCTSPSKTVLFSNQTDLVHQENIESQTPKMLTDGLHSRMCTRSFSALDLPAKAEQHVKRKPGPKPGLKSVLKLGPKSGQKPGPKTGVKPGSKASPKPGPKAGAKPGPKTLAKPVVQIEPEILLKIETPVKRKPGPKSGPKPGAKSGSKSGSKIAKLALKPGPKPGTKPGLKAADGLPLADTAPVKTSVGRPKGSVSKIKVVQPEETIQSMLGLQGRPRKSPKVPQDTHDMAPVIQDEKKANNDVKLLEESKNMVLRSRKPSQEKIAKEKEKIKEGDILPPTLADIKTSDVFPIVEESVTAEKTIPAIYGAGKATDALADSPAQLPLVNDAEHLFLEQSGEKASPQLKRKPSPKVSATPVKKKRGPKPKTKSAKPPHEQVGQVIPGPKRKRGPPKKTSAVPSPPKDGFPGIGESDATGDVPAASHCPTKTKVLPPRKGRGQKYEAMVQKITSPSSKKHLANSQMDGHLGDEAATKTLLQHVSKEGEATVFVNNTEMSEEELAHIMSVQDEIKVCREELKQEVDTHEVSQEMPSPPGIKEEDVTTDKPRQDGLIGGVEAGTEKIPSSAEAAVQVSAQDKWTNQASGLVTSAGTKPNKMKRKRWDMVESADSSAAVLDAESLIVTTPRLAKQRAIKNNHEMHLKQRRKKRKDNPAPEDSDTVKEVDTEVAEQKQEQVERDVTATEPAFPFPGRSEGMRETPKGTSAELVQKSKRGRKPSANVSKKKSKASPEQIPVKAVKVHKKPGPKPGMKDAMEVIEAVVRAAGHEGDEKGELERREAEDRPKARLVGPVVTASEKQLETISVKRIRCKLAYQNPKPSFCPHVRLNNSRDFSSWCAIVNKPDDAVVFQRRRKKGILRMRNPFTVAKGVPHSAAMALGPVIEKKEPDSRLACSLCGKPANYRDLGDLCGPYYAEENVPRKLLTTKRPEYLRNEPQRSDGTSGGSDELPGCSSSTEAEGSAEKDAGPETAAQDASGGSNRHHHWRHRQAGRTEHLGRAGGPRRPTLQERLRRMRQLRAGGARSPSHREGKDGLLQRLQVQAEANEHWTHENCAIWTKGIIMVAGRLYGLKEAANKSAQTVQCYYTTRRCSREPEIMAYLYLFVFLLFYLFPPPHLLPPPRVHLSSWRFSGPGPYVRPSDSPQSCYKCQIAGASLSCCWRGCSHKYHYVCAKEIGKRPQ